MEEGMALPRRWLLRALELETDREHGASRLSREAVRAFREAFLEAWPPDGDAEQARAALRAYAARLENAQRTMACVGNRIRRCVAALEGDRETALAAVDAVLADAETAGERLVEAAAPFFRPGLRLLTHSFSDTILAILSRYGDRLELVTVCEARPGNEGVRMAAGVGKLALPVRLITEAQLELFLPECDLALVGADRILPGGDVVNKAGTAVLARLCAAHKIQFYVAADRSKWTQEEDRLSRFVPERRSPAEILPDPPPGVEVMNIPFDRTPASLITGYLTEEGVLTAS